VIAPAIVYAALAATALGVAAWALERAALLVGRPARWAWVAATVGSLALPVGALLARPDAADPAAATARPERQANDEGAWAALLARAARRAARATVAPADLARFDEPLAGAWAAATSLLLLRRLTAARRLTRRARGWPSRIVAGRRVRVAPDAGPAVWGALRPEIVLPAWAVDDPRLPLIMRHEAEHCRARDPLLLAAAELAAVCVPWNPALWWQLRRLRAAVELDCDRRVLHGAASAPRIDRGLYGRLLLDVAGRATAGPTLAPGFAAWHVTALERRIHAMTAGRPSHAPFRAAVALGAALVAGAAAAALPRPAAAVAQPPATARTAGDSTPVRGARRDVRDSARVADAPLYVVNGRVVPPPPGRRSADGPPAGLPPAEQIERVDVLKGEQATRKYGARGRGGVVEITTKQAGRTP
jgi:beta-lactamase regulating signal transducer with metallopeptidase domain